MGRHFDTANCWPDCEGSAKGARNSRRRVREQRVRKGMGAVGRPIHLVVGERGRDRA